MTFNKIKKLAQSLEQSMDYLPTFQHSPVEPYNITEDSPTEYLRITHETVGLSDIMENDDFSFEDDFRHDYRKLNKKTEEIGELGASDFSADKNDVKMNIKAFKNNV